MIKTVVQKVKSHLYKKFKLNIKNKVEEEILIQLKDQVFWKVTNQVKIYVKIQIWDELNFGS